MEQVRTLEACMNLLFVHERFGSFAGAEANIYQIGAELTRRGHTVGILHGPGTGNSEARWREVFSDCCSLPAGNASPDLARNLTAVFDHFQPDAIYVHKLADLPLIEALLATGVPAVRMVHDHDLYCMRSYKYHYFSRHICTRPASLYCIFPCGAFLG